jgi:AraC-like DNA-binding protein
MPRPLRILQDLERGEWELIDARSARALHPHVIRYTGWFERRATPLQRRELPSHYVPLIINFGSAIRVSRAADPARWDSFGSFTTGAYDSYVLVETDAGAGGIQIDFSILGARLLLGVPLGELTNRAIALDDIFGRQGRELTSALHDAPSWDDRFDLLDRALTQRLATARPLSPEMVWTWNQMLLTAGQIPIGSISAHLGWSRRRLVERFKEDVGLAPKVFARVLRFHRAVETLKARTARRLSDVAVDCGYYDQAHFDRDFRAFAGVTPTELVHTLRPDGGFAAEA